MITDIFMPERNGLDVILELAPTDAKIIAMSGGGDLDRGDDREARVLNRKVAAVLVVHGRDALQARAAAALQERLAYAWQEVEGLRSQVSKPSCQAAEPVDREHGTLVPGALSLGRGKAIH